MASPPVLTPTGTTGWNFTKTQAGFEPAAYQKMKFIPTIEEAERLYGGLTIRKAARVLGQALAQSDEGNSIAAQNITDSPAALTPGGNIIKLAWSFNYDAQLDFNIPASTRDELTSGLAESTEASCLQDVASITTPMSVGSVDAPSLRKILAQLAGTSNGRAMVGDDGPQVYGIFTHRQLPALQDIPEVNNAQMRGDSENPYVRGVWVKGFGFMLMTTTVIYHDANGDHNCVYIGEAFRISWNQKSMLDQQVFDAQRKLIAYNNLGHSLIHNGRARAIRTTEDLTS